MKKLHLRAGKLFSTHATVCTGLILQEEQGVSASCSEEVEIILTLGGGLKSTASATLVSWKTAGGPHKAPRSELRLCVCYACVFGGLQSGCVAAVFFCFFSVLLAAAVSTHGGVSTFRFDSCCKPQHWRRMKCCSNPTFCLLTSTCRWMKVSWWEREGGIATPNQTTTKPKTVPSRVQHRRAQLKTALPSPNESIHLSDPVLSLTFFCHSQPKHTTPYSLPLRSQDERWRLNG